MLFQIQQHMLNDNPAKRVINEQLEDAQATEGPRQVTHAPQRRGARGRRGRMSHSAIDALPAIGPASRGPEATVAQRRRRRASARC